MTICPTVFIQYFNKRESFCLPRECVIYLSLPLCSRFTTITTSAMFWSKILLYHTVTSLTSAVTGFSPKSTKAYTTEDKITSADTSLV